MNVKPDSFIFQDPDGNALISLSPTPESVLAQNPRLTHSLAIVKIGPDYLFGWNKWRSRYEIFGGCVEQGESPRACILRECSEELGLQTTEIAYLGAMQLWLEPDYFSKDPRIEYGGLYGIALPAQNIDEWYTQVQDKAEIGRLALYSEIKGKEPIAQIDEKLLDYFK